MTPIQFNVDWHFKQALPGFASFINGSSEAYGIIGPECYGPNSHYRNDGNVLIKFADDFDNSPDPTPAQWKAYETLCEHHELIASRMIEELRKAMKDWLYSQYYEDTYRDDDIHIDLNDLQDDLLKSLISFESIWINQEEEDGIAFIVISGSCHYDEEHGIGFRIHGDQVVEFGSAEVAFSDENTDMKDENNPSLIYPHPKYGKLKPCEIHNNEQYVDYCIYQGDLEKFKTSLSFTKLDQTDLLPKLGLAVSSNQPHIVKYLLDSGVSAEKIHPYSGVGKIKYGVEVELLILNNMSAEAKEHYYRTVLEKEMMFELLRHHPKSNTVNKEETSDHLVRIQRIHQWSEEKILTQDFINQVVLRYMRSYNISSENKLERIFYPLLSTPIDEKNWPYHQTREDQELQIRNVLIKYLELFIRSYEYTLLTGKVSKMGTYENRLKEIEKFVMPINGIQLTTELVDEAREKIKDKSLLSPKEIHYKLLSSAM